LSMKWYQAPTEGDIRPHYDEWRTYQKGY
jgi:hypothetical protein